MPYDSLKMTHVDGKMHHLGVDETSVTQRVILTPDPQDAHMLSEVLENPVLEGDYREYVTYSGTVSGEKITLMSCGFGCMPMAIAVEELKHLHVTEIVKIASCAAISEEISPGEVRACKGAVRGEGVTREYIDLCYPAFPDMELLSAFVHDGKEPVFFRSHDCLKHESPYAPNGMERIKMWADMGVKVIDGETSALYVLGAILRLKTASMAVINENYVTGQSLTREERDRALKELFSNVCNVLIRRASEKGANI
jgi:uridine phosphorylase